LLSSGNWHASLDAGVSHSDSRAPSSASSPDPAICTLCTTTRRKQQRCHCPRCNARVPSGGLQPRPLWPQASDRRVADLLSAVQLISALVWCRPTSSSLAIATSEQLPGTDRACLPRHLFCPASPQEPAPLGRSLPHIPCASTFCPPAACPHYLSFSSTLLPSILLPQTTPYLSSLAHRSPPSAIDLSRPRPRFVTSPHWPAPFTGALCITHIGPRARHQSRCSTSGSANHPAVALRHAPWTHGRRPSAAFLKIASLKNGPCHPSPP
jgi:hypothetical protein